MPKMRHLIIRTHLIDLTALNWYKCPTRREYERAQALTRHMEIATAEWPTRDGGPIVIGITIEVA